MRICERTPFFFTCRLFFEQGIAPALCVISLPCGIRLLLFQIPAFGQVLLFAQFHLQSLQSIMAHLFLLPPRLQLLLIVPMTEGQQNKFLLARRIPPFAVGIVVLLQRFKLALLRTQPLQVTLELLIGIEYFSQNVQFQIAWEQDVFVDKIAHLVDGAKGKRPRECRQETCGELPKTVHQAPLPLLLPRLKHAAPVRIPSMKCPPCVQYAIRITEFNI